MLQPHPTLCCCQTAPREPPHYTGLKTQATNPEHPEKSVLANWINSLDASILARVTVKDLIDEVQNKLNQGVSALVSQFVSWLSQIHRDEHIQRKPVQYQLDEDIQAVAAINFTEKTLSILQNVSVSRFAVPCLA